MTLTLPLAAIVATGVAFVVGTLSGFLIGVVSTRTYWQRYFKHLGRF